LTEYRPLRVTRSTTPLTLTVEAASVFPLPSKLWTPIAANGPAIGDGATRKPVAVNEKRPLSVLSEQPVSAFAFAVKANIARTAVENIRVKFMCRMDILLCPDFDVGYSGEYGRGRASGEYAGVNLR
jgi:hypothetical protein